MKDERRLDSEAQRQAAEWVRALPQDDVPSLAWRSALNESIRAEAERKARKRWRFTLLRPTLGLAAAASLALVLFAPRSTPKSVPVASRLEASLLALHEESVRTADIVGTGVRPSEAPSAAVIDTDSLIDLEAGAL
ncbi:hypothetical protein EON82_17110 [bacterium]|nr:MAG: hypothetical protein EON82_17110 [bacterium]